MTDRKELIDRLRDEAKFASPRFAEIFTEAADALEAEQCAVVTSIAEAMDELLGEAIGIVPDAASAFHDYQNGSFDERRILSAITIRPASEVAEEATALAIEAAVKAIEATEKGCTSEDLIVRGWAVYMVNSLHTPATRAALERMKKGGE